VITRRRRGPLVAVLAAATALALGACTSSSDIENTAASEAAGPSALVVDTSPDQDRVHTEKNQAAIDLLPPGVVDDGVLKVATSAYSAPLAFYADDNATAIGSDPDTAQLIADALGLRLEIVPTAWENWPLATRSGGVDVTISNVTVTEERKQLFDFSSYRVDTLGFLAAADSTIMIDEPEDVAGLKVAVGSGTNQEKILLEWKAKLEKEGKKLTVKYFQETNSLYLALNSGKIDAYFGPNPGIAYHIAQTANTPNATRNAGTFSGAGETLQGLIAATAKKDSGLAKPVADAINHLIEGGQYAKWLKAYNLTNEGLPKSEINPPGLPLDNQ